MNEVSESEVSDNGRAWCNQVAVAAQWGTYVITYQVGSRPVQTGGTVRVQLPDSWHAWRRNGAKGVQSSDPRSDNFVTAVLRAGLSTSSAVITCKVENGVVDDVVKSNRVGIDGRPSRYVYVTQVVVESGVLQAGDEVSILFGDTSGGSRGFAAGLHPQGPEQVIVAVDHDGSGEGYVLPPGDSPWLSVEPGPAVEAVAYLPSVLQVGRPAIVHVVLLDAEGNLVEESIPNPIVQVWTGACDLLEVRRGSDGGTFEVVIRPVEEGVLRLIVQFEGLPETTTNPGWVSVSEPPHRIFWGDLHSHAEHSFDGVGRYPYEYARDVSHLDFYALTEHCELWGDEDWEYVVESAAKFHEPGKFVTFLAYEATFHEPWGHHNVYFRDPADAVVLGANAGTVLDLWDALRGRRALTIPHHTGVAFSPKTAGSIPGSTSPAVDWQYHDAELRRNVEIYSGHGQCEYYDPTFDLSYENSDFSTNTSRLGAHYARDAWEYGHKLGVIGSSDNHRAQPGRGELGLAAVLAPSLDRESIFDALHDRLSYATTGTRMLMDFRAGHVLMGGTADWSAGLSWELRVSGTAPLASVEIFRGIPNAARSVERVAVWNPNSLDFAITWSDLHRPEGPAFYYARARQTNIYRGRRPTAWSSPIWVRMPENGPVHTTADQ